MILLLTCNLSVAHALEFTPDKMIYLYSGIAHGGHIYSNIATAKSGVDPPACVDLVKHVKAECPNLEFSGLMTIGMPDYTSTPENFKVIISHPL